MTSHARPCYEDLLFRRRVLLPFLSLSTSLSGLYTYLPTRLAPAYIHSASARTLACPGIRSLLPLPRITVLVPFPYTYVPAMDGRPPFTSPSPCCSIPRRPMSMVFLLPTYQSRFSRSFSLVVTPALLLYHTYSVALHSIPFLRMAHPTHGCCYHAY